MLPKIRNKRQGVYWLRQRMSNEKFLIFIQSFLKAQNNIQTKKVRLLICVYARQLFHAAL